MVSQNVIVHKSLNKFIVIFIVWQMGWKYLGITWLETTEADDAEYILSWSWCIRDWIDI